MMNESIIEEIKKFSVQKKLNFDNELHYLDSDPQSNTDTAIVCLHGNPSWSWYYRSLFQQKWPWRVISIDHLGMGLSSKVDKHISIEEHAKNVADLLSHLKISNVHFVVHDWGGVIAILTSINYPIKVKSIVGMNTAFFNKKSIPWRILAVARFAWSKFLNKKVGMFSFAAPYMSTNLPLSSSVRNAYIYPYLFEDERQGVLNFLNEIPWDKNSLNGKLLDRCENFIKKLDVPMKAIWGLKDFCFDESYLDYWKNICPQLEMVKLFNAGHWCLEDEKEKIINELQIFWNKL